MLVKSEQRVPIPADSVTVQCDEGEIIVDVKQNFLGNVSNGLSMKLKPDQTKNQDYIVAV